MVIGVCTIELEIPASRSLKDKRSVLKPLVARVRKDFNVSVAEVDSHDTWQHATICVACVSTDARYAHGLLEKVIDHIERSRLNALIADYSIEML